MAISDKTKEVERLLKAFETEAANFYDVEFHTYFVTEEGPSTTRIFRQPNHGIVLWQYYGQFGAGGAIERFVENVKHSDFKWGIRGANITQLGLIEGPACKKFIRMANRAGSLFDENEASDFNTRVVREISAKELQRNPKCRPAVGTNHNPLAIWLNYLLFYLSLTYPGRDRATKIEPDLFTLSLLALERLARDHVISKSDRSVSDVTQINFRVAVSFPGEKRRFVSRVVDTIRSQLGPDSVFYDFDYQSQIARPNADVLLQNIYHKQTDLVVVFLCSEYAKKQWCGLEWRAIRDLMKSKQDGRIMFVKFDNAEIDGSFSIDGYIDASKFNSRKVAEFILERLSVISNDA